jgi:hypothetical protein
MSEFLLVYDRETGAGRVRRFDDSESERLRQARVAVASLAGPNEEVVLLCADSEDTVRVDR